MSRGWQPGDVQVVLSMHASRVQEFAGWLRAQAKTPAARVNNYAEQIEAQGHGARLAVIDYEDREQIERLIRLQDIAFDGSARDPVAAADVRDMQAALREFADPKPPKPDEPTGLGAVVEDAAGELWLRSYLPGEDADVLGKPWKNGPVCKNWQIVDAVRVLSEGVQR